ncbi:MAG: hypothetical protein WCP55_10135, partial [Lentisphaerota bacterium]
GEPISSIRQLARTSGKDTCGWACEARRNPLIDDKRVSADQAPAGLDVNPIHSRPHTGKQRR